MSKRKLTEKQELQVRREREMSVYKRDDMIQKARHRLTVREQRCVLYAVSKIKPSDTAFDEFIFDIKDFYALCGLSSDSYTELKAILRGLRDKSWWITIDDEGTESAVSWFSVARTNKGKGKVTLKFHEDMMPFLLQLAEQNAFFTQYNLQYVLPMTGQYSSRLYEILKSYQKNNLEWFFDIDHLKELLDCQNYKNFNDFKRFALEPAVKEVNKFSDINVAWDIEKEGRRVSRVIFYMAEKNEDALLEAKRAIRDELDGQLSIEDIIKNFDDEDSVKRKFWRENAQK